MKKKVALFTNTLSGGGIERATINIANQLANNGYKVDLLLAVCKGDLFEEVDDKVNIICLGKKNTRFLYKLTVCPTDIKLFIFIFGIFKKVPKSIRAIPALREYLVMSKPDVLIASPTLVNIAAVIACAGISGKPKLFVGEMTVLSKVQKYQKKYLLKRLTNNISSYYKHANKIICVSEGTKHDLNQNYGITLDNCVVLTNPIDRNQLIEKSNQILESSIFDISSPYILAVGRLAIEKNFSRLIESFGLISDKTNANLLILGEGELRAELERKIISLGLSNRVTLLGFVNNPYPYINNCELLVLSSNREGLPNVVLEAIVLEKKIVATDCSQGVRDIIEKYINGVLVKMDDNKEMATALITTIDKPFMKSNMELSSSDYLDFLDEIL